MLLLFFGLFTAYSQRVNLTVAIVAWSDNSSNPEFQVYEFAQYINKSRAVLPVLYVELYKLVKWFLVRPLIGPKKMLA